MKSDTSSMYLQEMTKNSNKTQQGAVKQNGSSYDEDSLLFVSQNPITSEFLMSTNTTTSKDEDLLIPYEPTKQIEDDDSLPLLLVNNNKNLTMQLNVIYEIKKLYWMINQVVKSETTTI